MVRPRPGQARHFENVDTLENKDEKLATKKDHLKPTNANWVPVYDGLNAEIKLRHFQNYTRGNEKPRQRSSGITFMTAPPNHGAIKKGVNGNPFEIDKRMLS